MSAQKENALRLLKTARGQIDGVIRMVEEGRGCMEVSDQLSAACSVARRAQRELLKERLHRCAEETVGGDPQKAEELLAILQKFTD